jgi:hypothetical protein
VEGARFEVFERCDVLKKFSLMKCAWRSCARYKYALGMCHIIMIKCGSCDLVFNLINKFNFLLVKQFMMIICN